MSNPSDNRPVLRGGIEKSRGPSIWQRIPWGAMARAGADAGKIILKSAAFHLADAYSSDSSDASSNVLEPRRRPQMFEPEPPPQRRQPYIYQQPDLRPPRAPRRDPSWTTPREGISNALNRLQANRSRSAQNNAYQPQFEAPPRHQSFDYQSFVPTSGAPPSQPPQAPARTNVAWIFSPNAANRTQTP